MNRKNILLLSLIAITVFFITSVNANNLWENREGRPMAQGNQFERGDHLRRGARMQENWSTKTIEELDEIEPGIKGLFTELKNKGNYKLKRFMRALINNREYNFIGHKKYKEGKKMAAKSLKLELESLSIVDKICSSNNDTEKETLKAELKDKLNKSFEAKTQIRSYHIKMLTEKLQEIRNKNKTRQNNKDSIVENRLNDLLQDKPNLQW